MKRRQSALLLAGSMALLAGALLLSAPAYSYLPELTGKPNFSGTPQSDKWDLTSANHFAVTWQLNPQPGSNVQGTATLDSVINASFNTWLAAPNAALSGTIKEGTPSTLIAVNGSDGINLICFVCTNADFTKDPGTLAVTITTTATAAGQSNFRGGQTNFVGQIIDADIAFNPDGTAVTWNTDGTCPSSSSSSKPVCENLQVVATHEIGHFLGLDHSGVVRAIMFPAASNEPERKLLSYDDVAGISLLYPKSVADVATGAISGKVTFPPAAGSSTGSPIFGAHVFAESTTTTNLFSSSFNIRKSPIGTLSGVDGSYTITGLPPDTYTVTAEPLDGPVTNADVSGYPAAFGQTAVQTNFTTRWH